MADAAAALPLASQSKASGPTVEDEDAAILELLAAHEARPLQLTFARWEPCLSTGVPLLVAEDTPHYSLDADGTAVLLAADDAPQHPCDEPTPPPKRVVRRALLLPSPDTVMEEPAGPQEADALDVILELAKAVRTSIALLHGRSSVVRPFVQGVRARSAADTQLLAALSSSAAHGAGNMDARLHDGLHELMRLADEQQQRRQAALPSPVSLRTTNHAAWLWAAEARLAQDKRHWA